MSEHAATWITFADEVDRGNQLGAANLAAERVGRVVATALEDMARQRKSLRSRRRRNRS